MRIPGFLFTAALVMLLSAPTMAQTAITYQGQLQQNGSPVDGQDVELYFELYDDADPGAGTLIADDGPFTVPVSDGLFQAEIDFGDVSFEVARYLRIRVDGIWLDGTQEITSTPLAQYALGAGGVQWSNVLNAPEFWRLGGNVGTTPGSDFIGTTDSTALELGVNGERALRLQPATNPNSGFLLPNVIGGSDSNSASSFATTVSGGQDNVASAPRATVSGGHRNEASGLNSAVGGGNSNTASNSYSTVAGGNRSTAAGFYSTVGGGAHNTVEARFGVIGGGGWTNSNDRPNTSNVVLDEYGTIGGGGNNQAGSDDGDASSDRWATVGGGRRNTASDQEATVGGGWSNEASGLRATVGGGQGNEASDGRATVGGGGSNTASASNSTVGGGFLNTADGSSATVPGGLRGAAVDTNSFVWNDGTAYHDIPNSSSDGLSSDKAVDGEPVTGVNTFSVSATGGVRFITGSSSVTYIAGGSSGWATTSSRAAKTNIEPVDPQNALAGVESMEVATWEYKDDDGKGAGTIHIGPMAEDFHDAFDVGSSDEHINAINADGVALAAIQGLSEKVDEKDERIDELWARNQQLEAELDEIRQQTQRNARLAERNAELENRLAALEAMLLEDRRIAEQ